MPIVWDIRNYDILFITLSGDFVVIHCAVPGEDIFGEDIWRHLGDSMGFCIPVNQQKKNRPIKFISPHHTVSLKQ